MSGLKLGVAILGVVSCALAVSNYMLWVHVQGLVDAAEQASSPVAPTDSASARAPSAQQAATKAPVQPELAPHMARLQTLTHKLGLALNAGERKLAEFYLYESREVLSEIQEEVPEYRGHAIAVLLDRFLKPAYEQLEEGLGADSGAALSGQFVQLIGACNGCHTVTQHQFIRIPDTIPDSQPYLQEFADGDHDETL